MLLIELEVQSPVKTPHTYYARILIIQAWERYLISYVGIQSVDGNEDAEYTFIFYGKAGGSVVVRYYLPDSIVKEFGLNNLKEIIPYWSSYRFIPEEEKYSLATVALSSGGE